MVEPVPGAPGAAGAVRALRERLRRLRVRLRRRQRRALRRPARLRRRRTRRRRSRAGCYGGSSMLLVVGLGNPGREHEGQRHNVGFMAVDALARAEGWPDYKAKWNGALDARRARRSTRRVLKPQTYMNLSGDERSARRGVPEGRAGGHHRRPRRARPAVEGRSPQDGRRSRGPQRPAEHHPAPRHARLRARARRHRPAARRRAGGPRLGALGRSIRSSGPSWPDRRRSRRWLDAVRRARHSDGLAPPATNVVNTKK